ncbi:hypothetical protein [Mycoplasmopsis cricetuli]|uniref:hypothetical protein n=1 Tax=Mycoplasmopsis cricetuli TaxID=171283 RepID=UPI00046F8F7E|nr:hypothetical protein [Mycoplasmopsis cricetuli]
MENEKKNQKILDNEEIAFNELKALTLNTNSHYADNLNWMKKKFSYQSLNFYNNIFWSSKLSLKKYDTFFDLEKVNQIDFNYQKKLLNLSILKGFFIKDFNFTSNQFNDMLKNNILENQQKIKKINVEIEKSNTLIVNKFKL